MATESIYEKLNRITLKGYPTIASIEVTSLCNAHCNYCYIKDASIKDLTTKQLFTAIDKFSKNGIFHLHITGGEPFLRPDILDILSYAKESNFFYCSIFSNGILLNEKHLDFLIKNQDFFVEIQMSVFSHVPAKNDAYFGVPGAFDAIMKNALLLKKNGLRVTLAMSVFDFNIDGLEESRNFFEFHELPILLATSKIITDQRIKNNVAGSTSYAFFKQYLLSLPPKELNEHKKTMKQAMEMPRSDNAELCFGRFDFIYMDSRGDLAQCLCFRKMKLGNIFEDRSIHDILQNSSDYKAVCAHKKTDIKKCSVCKFYNFCSVCLGTIHSESNSLDSTDDQACNYAQALYDLII